MLPRPNAAVFALLALLAPLVPLVVGCGARPGAVPDAAPHQAVPDAWAAQRNYPPLVFASQAWLQCDISSTKPGRQVMTTTSGQGFSFDSVMSPIGKNLLEVQGKGMRYKFDAFPAAAFPAKFTGLGEGTVTAMKAEVEVSVQRYTQAGGAGTEITFDASDITADAAYVEFTGVWVRTSDGKRFPFRVLFGSVPSGSGKVQPASAAPVTSIAAKAVAIGTPQRPASVTTSLFEEESDVAPLPAQAR
ncbi:MAG: hypothetical protein ACRELB_06940 [Polyangiaceae bacterium]